MTARSSGFTSTANCAGIATDQAGPIDYPPKTWLALGVYKDDNEHHTMNGQMQDAAIFNVVDARPGRRTLPRPQARLPRDGRDAAGRHRLADVSCATTSAPAPPEPLKLPLHLAWTHQTRFPAEPGLARRSQERLLAQQVRLEERVTYDRAFHLVSVGDRVYFGSSADDAVFCLDAETGRTLWSYVTEGPVRLAPTIADDQVLFGSDDGFVYCLEARKTARSRWKKLLAPSPAAHPGQ